LASEEFADGSGLDWYEYGLREYDAQIGRFFRLDPLTDAFPWWTPYQYAGCEPIANTDLDGAEPNPVNNDSTIPASGPPIKSNLQANPYQYESPRGYSFITPANHGNYYYTQGEVYSKVGSGVKPITSWSHENIMRYSGEQTGFNAMFGFMFGFGNAAMETVSTMYNAYQITNGNIREDQLRFMMNIQTTWDQGKEVVPSFAPAGIFHNFMKSKASTMLYGSAFDKGAVGGETSFNGAMIALPYGLKGLGGLGASRTMSAGEVIVAEGRGAGLNVLSKSEMLRIENAATRINKPITVVGSRARGTAGAYSDWDYVIDGLNSKSWSKIKNSLPGSRSILDNTPRNIDIFKGPVNRNLSHITIHPR
jgi:RHS repeat-associated protein